jgi:hypothetical protein
MYRRIPSLYEDDEFIGGSKLEELKSDFESIVDFLYTDYPVDNDEIDFYARKIAKVLDVHLPKDKELNLTKGI